VARIAETYLDHLFPGVAYTDKKMEDINLLPPFAISPLVQAEENKDSKPLKEEFLITLDVIQQPAHLGTCNHSSLLIYSN